MLTMALNMRIWKGYVCRLPTAPPARCATNVTAHDRPDRISMGVFSTIRPGSPFLRVHPKTRCFGKPFSRNGRGISVLGCVLGDSLAKSIRLSGQMSIKISTMGSETSMGFDNRPATKHAITSTYLWMLGFLTQLVYVHIVSSQKTVLNTSLRSAIQATDSTCIGWMANNAATNALRHREPVTLSSSENSSSTHARCSKRFVTWNTRGSRWPYACCASAGNAPTRASSIRETQVSG